MMPPVATDPAIEKLIAADAPVAIGVSGGKDSQAAAIATLSHLDANGHKGPRILIHSDLGSVEWDDSIRICEEMSKRLGIYLVVVRRISGDMMARWESRWQSSIRRWTGLEVVKLILPWSTPSMRFCTSELKTQIIASELRRRFKGQTVINVTGVRREESPARAKGTIASRDTNGNYSWRPISNWKLGEVFASIAEAGMKPHPAYATLTRVSCRFCIMSSLADLQAAAKLAESHDIFRRMVGLEAQSSFAFQGNRWLADIAPDLLGTELQADIATAKETAVKRVKIESAITKDMQFVKGWPTRMLTNDEADILASVRNQLSELFGFQTSYLDRSSIHERYASLIADRAAKAPGAEVEAETPELTLA
ncbi:3'-phosphoadenosine 5'-phosphosulfate sulfotransferase (PAPS reductase)/FAD synthetase [Bradyrhizobium sp. USDA 4341]